jgi:LacI family transcriptional regulator
MKSQKPISIGAIVAATGLSRATIDRVINKRSGVHPRTQAHVLRVIDRLEKGPLLDSQEVSAFEPRKIHRLEIVIQGGEAFTGTLLEATERVTKSDTRGTTLHTVASRSDGETLELIRTLGADSDGLALVGKNIEPVKAALGHLLAAGKPVVALVSDLDTSCALGVRWYR